MSYIPTVCITYQGMHSLCDAFQLQTSASNELPGFVAQSALVGLLALDSKAQAIDKSASSESWYPLIKRTFSLQ